MNSELLYEYFEDLKRLLISEYNYDVKIYIGKKPNVKEFRAHSYILYTRCLYFKNALDTMKKQDGYYIFEESNISETVFKTILRYLYTSKAELNVHTGINIIKLLIAADELGLKSFCKCIMKYFIEKHQKYIKENPVKILRLVNANESFNELKSVCLKEICADSRKLFESSKFKSLEKSILLEIFKRDDLVVNEIEVWENVIKWGLARHPEIDSNNIDDWSIQNFSKFEKTIKEFIPLIRFKGISKKDYFDKVIPYQLFFSQALQKEISSYYSDPDEQQLSSNLLPPRDSKMISELESVTYDQNLILLFASLIDKQNQPYDSPKKVKYDFKLLYHSNRDDLNGTEFHEKCDNVNKTLVIAQIENSNRLVGGYNPLDWCGNNIYKRTTDSFIFNIGDKNDMNTTQFSYVINDDYNHAIGCNSSFLPIFGDGWDIIFQSNGTISSTSKTYGYINIINFSRIDELSVFQVIDKK